MRPIRSVAFNTVKETLRDKIYYSVIFFAIFLVFLTYFLGQLTYRDEAKITMDLGLAVINFSGILISIFLGVSLVLKEIERKTLYTIVSRPIPRFKFYLGKFLGLSSIIFAIVLCMGVIVVVNVKLLNGIIPISYYQALILMFFEMLAIVSIAMFFSTFTTTTLSSIFTLGFYFISHSSSAFKMLITKATGAKLIVFKILKFISPNFSTLNLKNLVPYVDSIGAGAFTLAMLYAATYVVFFIIVGSIIFSRKDFK